MLISSIPYGSKRQRQEALIITVGLFTVLSLGVIAAIALVIGAFWCLFQLTFLALQSIIEVSRSIGATFNAADPLVRFLILVAIGCVVFRASKRVFARG